MGSEPIVIGIANNDRGVGEEIDNQDDDQKNLTNINPKL